jgi:hypothetical protein
MYFEDLYYEPFLRFSPYLDLSQGVCQDLLLRYDDSIREH